MNRASTKAALQRALPAPLFVQAIASWRRGRDALDCIGAFGARVLLAAAGRRLPDRLLFFGLLPGNDLLCTAVLRELRKRGSENVWMISDHPELFEEMHDASNVVPITSRYARFAKWWPREVELLQYVQFDEDDEMIPPRHHFIAELCRFVGIRGAVTLRPYFVLTESEKRHWISTKDCIAIQSSGMGGKLPIRNKEWFPDRFQTVVNNLHKQYEFIQLGSAIDPPLQHVKDLRGRTSIRDAAAVLHHARFYIGNAGFLMHLARAVECPSVIVYGGREAPWQSGYACNVNLSSTPPCAPCWRFSKCDFEHKCMTEITADDVVQGALKLLTMARNPLLVETAEL